jgi:uncharacterized membrane protein YfcA
MLFLAVLLIAVCVLGVWVVLHLSVDVVQVLLAVVMMILAWHLTRRRPNASMADDFKYW